MVLLCFELRRRMSPDVDGETTYRLPCSARIQISPWSIPPRVRMATNVFTKKFAWAFWRIRDTLRSQMNRSGKLHALLSTARVANIPSVVSNVWLGVALGLAHGLVQVTAPLWPKAGCLAAAGVLLYVGGNFFNDWMDRNWDAQHRPERALPRGLFPTGLYAGLATGCIGAGVALGFAASSRSGLAAAGIAVAIVIYTLAHKRTAWAVVPMGLCRGLLPAMGSLAFFPYLDRVWPMACALLCYIAGLSLSARHESQAKPPIWVGVTARGLLLTTAVLAAWGNKDLYTGALLAVCSALPYLAWTGFILRFRRKPVPRLVSGLLAGIPLVDWMVLLPLSFRLNTSEDGVMVMMVCFTLPPLAFISALLLQRLAPAT
jgi:hypothetical protein